MVVSTLWLSKLEVAHALSMYAHGQLQDEIGHLVEVKDAEDVLSVVMEKDNGYFPTDEGTKEFDELCQFFNWSVDGGYTWALFIKGEFCGIINIRE